MSVINTNITSVIAQKNLTSSKSSLTTAMERLSSGLRINSAKDDAAGQAISNRMTAQVKGLAQAQRNANDGISVAQTAEGALNQINDNLQRVRELSVQAQNDTNSADDKASIQAEITQRLGEIDRVSRETNFNGVKVLSANRTLDIQVGANDGEVIGVGLEEITSTTLGLEDFSVSGLTGPITKLSEVSPTSGGTVTADVTIDTSGAGNVPSGTFTLHSYNNGANYAIQDKDGNMYKIAAGDIQSDPDAADFGKVTITFANTAAWDAAKTSYDTDATAGLTATANPLAAIDSALKKVDTLRSNLGAVQNRFESAITNLSTNETNLTSARSRIQDADYAVEVANMTRAQILQQAGTSVLSQANQVPQGVLSLLR